MICSQCKSEKLESNKSIFSINNEKMEFITLSCGHSFVNKKKDFISSDGRTLYPFQEVGIEFLSQPLITGRGKLIADEQGLGKTVQACGYLYENKSTRLPALIVTKSKLTRQWMHEIFRWNKEYAFLISGNGIIKGFNYYIVSVDLLRNIKTKDIRAADIKTIIIDECQSIKNKESKRSQEVFDLAKPSSNCTCKHSWKEHNFESVLEFNSTKYNQAKECLKCECKNYQDDTDLFIIGLSGTPILNRASEYFPILHLIDSVRFPSETSFKYQWIDTTFDFRTGKNKEKGITNVKRWKEFTSDLIIRRERSEVMPDLPPIDRQIRWVDLTKTAQDEYDKQEKGFVELAIQAQLEGTEGKEMSNLLAYISRMRHIIGLSKVPDCVDYVSDFILSTNRKIIIFVHHKDVGEILVKELNKWLKDGAYQECLTIRGNQDADSLIEVQNKFNNDMSYKVLVASTLAAGEGLNLQEQCGDCIILERQWNPPKEEQAISRLVRIGFMKNVEIKLNSVIAQYLLAIGTIDDWMTSIIEEKRAIFEQTVNSKDVEAAEMELMRALMDKIIKEGRRKWKLSA